MKKPGAVTQSREQNKYPETTPQEPDVYELLDKKSKIVIIKMTSQLKEKMIHKQKERISAER